MSGPNRLSTLVGRGPLLLDFDGPVCSIFAGLPAPHVAGELVKALKVAKADVPPAIAAEPDPLAVLRWTGEACGSGAAKLIDDVLSDLELRAVATALPTPGGHDSIRAARAAGLPVALVSNNSARAVNAYVSTHGLADLVSPVIGRTYGRPDRMKPNAAPILEAVRTLGRTPADCVMVGDSLTDLQGARAAGVPFVGYANRPGKVQALRDSDAVITAMADLAAVLASLSR
jgi:HAD superfamily hydrolase (TIGR01509 family)